MNKKPIYMIVNADIHAKLKSEALRLNTTMTALLVRWVKDL